MKIFLIRPINGDHGQFHANTIQDFPEDYCRKLISAKLGRESTADDKKTAKKALTHSPLARRVHEAEKKRVEDLKKAEQASENEGDADGDSGDGSGPAGDDGDDSKDESENNPDQKTA